MQLRLLIMPCGRCVAPTCNRDAFVEQVACEDKKCVPFALGKLSASIARDAGSVATRNSRSVNYVAHVNVMIALTMGTWCPMEIGATNAAFAKLRPATKMIHIVNGAPKSLPASEKCK